jgi:hypothetical protein
MLKMRISSLLFGVIFLLMLVILLAFRKTLFEIHGTEIINYFSSDAGNYFWAYQTLFSDVNLTEAPDLLLVGSPILFMNIVDGNLVLIQLWQLMLMCVSIKVGIDCFHTMRGRISFIMGSLIFPYFLFGFLSLNKEVYAMCATIFFSSFYLRGKWLHLMVALSLAMISRYYMLIALVMLFYLVPRLAKPRYWLFFVSLIVISIAAPIVKSIIPGYSSEGLLDAPSRIGGISSGIIDSYGYWIFYPLKYFILIPMRAYSFFIDSSRNADAMEALVSILSLFMVIMALYLVLIKKRIHPMVRRFILLGFIAPMPIMWSEIMHWRYFSFVYFFFMFAVILHFVDRHKNPLSQLKNVNHA